MTAKVIYTARAVCMSHDLSMNTLSDLVRYGVVTPRQNTPDKWVFNKAEYDRLEMAARYYHYLKLEPEAAAIAVELYQDLARVKYEKLTK